MLAYGHCEDCKYNWTIYDTKRNSHCPKCNKLCYIAPAETQYPLSPSRDPQDRFRELLLANNQLLERARNAENLLIEVIETICNCDRNKKTIWNDQSACPALVESGQEEDWILFEKLSKFWLKKVCGVRSE